MGVNKEFIIPEEKLEEMFRVLPPVVKDSIDYQVVFSFGSEYDLLTYLKDINDQPYPLIWLETPYVEHHKRTRVELRDISLVIAMNSNENTYNKKRLEENFKPTLLKVANNIKKLFLLSPTIYTNDEYKLSKFYRYGSDDKENENKFPAVWDAIKLTFTCDINDKCFHLKSIE